MKVKVLSHTVLSDSFHSMDYSLPGSSVHGILQARMGYHALLQGIFLTQGLNSRLLHWPVSSLPVAPPGKPSLLFMKLPFEKPQKEEDAVCGVV